MLTEKTQGDLRGTRVPADEDLSLVERAQTGDTEAFEELVRRHECRVFRTAGALTGNPEDAEEAGTLRSSPVMASRSGRVRSPAGPSCKPPCESP